MTLWFGVGLIIYIHLLFFTAAYFSYAVFRRLEAQAGPCAPNARTASTLDLDPGEEPEPRKAEPTSTPQQRVLDLSSRGLRADQIARETEMPRAEIEFVMKLDRLRQRKARAAAQ